MVNCCTRLFAIVVSVMLLSSLLVQTANASSPSAVRIAGKHGIYTLPVVDVRAQYYVSYGYKPTLKPIKKLPTIDFSLTPAEARQYAVYWMNLGGINSHQQHGLEVLAPRNWITVRAEVATNGSGDIVLAASNSTKSPRLMFGWEWNGTSLSGIADYFPKLRAWAIKQGGGDPNLFPPIRGIHTTALDRNAVRYKIGNTRHISASGVAMESIRPQWLFATGTVSRFKLKCVNLMEQFMVRVAFNSLRMIQ